MTHNPDQNGRPQSQLSNSNRQRQWVRTQNSLSEPSVKICRDFVWGICSKGAQCKFRHDLDVESMKSIVVFCNDFQNRIGCNRPDCSYIHATREEKELFLTAGQIPRALAERHISISSAQNSVPEANIPMGFVPDSYNQAPAPPPPPPPPPPEGHPPAPTPPAMSKPAPPPSTAMPMTLAPPPPPPATVASINPRVPAHMYTVPPPQVPQNNTMPVGFLAPPPPHVLPPKFDASKPPPPLPMNGPVQSNSLKHSASDPPEAGPSKMKKAESIKDVDSLCDNCVQREIRIEMCQEEIQKLNSEKEYQSRLYKEKLEEYKTGRDMLKSVISPQLFWMIDHYLENSSQDELGNNLLGHCSQTLQSGLPASALVNNTVNLQSIIAAVQKTNETNSTTSERIQGLLEALQNRSVSNPAKFPNGAPHNFPSGGAAPPVPSTVQVPAATTTYLPYQPAALPPANHPYQHFPVTNTNVPMSNGTMPQARMAAPPAAALPTTSACTPAPPLHTHNGVTYTQQYASWRYPPQPPFYPPQ